MRKTAIALSLLLAPALVQAQSGVQVQTQASANVSTSAKTPKTTTNTSAATSANANAAQAANASSASSANTNASSPRQLSADAQGKVDANLQVARAHNLPQQPIRQRVAEGQAKGASDAQIVTASGRTLADMQATSDAMVRAGHTSPSDAEITRGSQLMARGYTSAQIEAVARKAPPSRSLTVSFETLASMQAQGTSTTNAVAQVETQLASRATDAQLSGLVSAGNATGGASTTATATGGVANVAGNVAGSVAGSTAAGAGAAATGALGVGKGSTNAGVTGTATTAVGGLLPKH